MCKGNSFHQLFRGDASAEEIDDHRPQPEFTRVNGALERCGGASAVSGSDVNAMSARKRIRPITRIDRHCNGKRGVR